MKTMHALLAAACVAAAAPASHAVFLITNGNAQLSSALTPFLPDSNLPTADFRPDAGGGPDHMFGYNWGYRAPGGGNRGFSWLDTPVQTVVGNTLTLVYTNAGPNPVGFNRFNAKLTVQVFDTVIPNTARVESTMEFAAATSNAGATAWEVFHIADLDLNGTAANDTYTITSPNIVTGTVTEGASTDKINFVGFGAPRFEVNTGTILRNKIIGGPLLNMTNALGPVTGDMAYGFQWTVTLNPGQMTRFRTAFGLNMPPVPPPCVCDLTSDGVTDVNDLVIVLANFGTVVPPFTLGDLDGNGIVNVADLTIFLGCFGTPC